MSRSSSQAAARHAVFPAGAAPLVAAWIVLFSAIVARPAIAQDEPCSNAPRDPEFTACWNAEFKKSDADVQQKLHVLAERHRKDEPELHKLMMTAQRAWLAWREASCKVDTFESKGGSGFSVYWDRCRIKMNKARAGQLQELIDNP